MHQEIKTTCECSSPCLFTRGFQVLYGSAPFQAPYCSDFFLKEHAPWLLPACSSFKGRPRCLSFLPFDDGFHFHPPHRNNCILSAPLSWAHCCDRCPLSARCLMLAVLLPVRYWWAKPVRRCPGSWNDQQEVPHALKGQAPSSTA